MKIYYNISYSYDYVICIISNKEIGIDIEKIRKTNINTKKIFATKIEQNYKNIICSDNNIITKQIKFHNYIISICEKK